ncbi:hypothetical protein [Aureibacter tunicatorum]|uniref:Uncharacterized protein n=1 Tax=Aureibacter tunicatorum TaxID=866807 RepID=A0AAE3XSY6_9BACT|nr:hypothetical protein [Aureibacter tunicatorum]MDR6241865.1 hypothetical protein [Aureibacter tunicatorum]BDD07112.1 hypothetical protein AUTU_45950 [Aureibacter tunicatorum]
MIIDLQAEEGRIRLEVIDGLASRIDLKFYSIGFNVFFSNYDTFQSAYSKHNGYGSMIFLLEEVDTYLFDKNTLNLDTVWLTTPYSIKVNYTDKFPLKNLKYKSLRIKEPKNFSIPLYQNFIYYFESDTFVYSNDTNIDFSKLDNLRIAEDFHALSDNDVIVGWAVTNCSKYLFDFWDNHYYQPSESSKRLLAQVFELFTEDTFDKIDDKDPVILSQLQDLLEVAKKEKCMAVYDTIDDWIC